jgi:hypothetical protein
MPSQGIAERTRQRISLCREELLDTSKDLEAMVNRASGTVRAVRVTSAAMAAAGALASLTARIVQKILHGDQIEPPPELVSDLAISACLDEAEPLMEAN